LTESSAQYYRACRHNFPQPDEYAVSRLSGRHNGSGMRHGCNMDTSIQASLRELEQQLS
jgi:hypothetical protein